MTRADRVHSTPPLSTSLSNSSETATLAVNSRRRFLSQAAAVTAGGAALATALSAHGSAAAAAQAPDPILEAIAPTIPAISAPTADAELIALGQKISELRILERKACEEADRFSVAFDAIKLDKPRVLLWQPDDPIDLPPDVVDYSIGEHVAEPWWIDMRLVLQEEATGLRPSTPPPGRDQFGYFTEAEIARRGEVLDAWREWQRGLDQARQDSGLADAEDKADVISVEMGDLYRQMLELKPQTLDGFRALALATIENCWGDEVPAPAHAADAQGIAVLISALTGVPIGVVHAIESAV
jgi:hypothetical protein